MYENADYWVECFNLIRRIIGGVDYKGVREIMKVCCSFCEHVIYLYVTNFSWIVCKVDNV